MRADAAALPLVRRAFAAAGLDPGLIADRRAFGALTGRDERTVRNWLRGGVVPPEARAWCARLAAVRVAASGAVTVRLGPGGGWR